MKIEVRLLPGVRPKIVPTHICLHETDNTDAGADADAHARYLLGADAKKRKVSWHYTIDAGGVIKHLPGSSRGSHAGTAEGNSKSIGIELCVNGGFLADETWNNAVELVKALMVAYGIPASRVVPHRHWSGKHCPAMILDSGRWDDFIAAISG